MHNKYDDCNHTIVKLTIGIYDKYLPFTHKQITINEIVITTIFLVFPILTQKKNFPTIWRGTPVKSQQST